MKLYKDNSIYHTKSTVRGNPYVHSKPPKLVGFDKKFQKHDIEGKYYYIIFHQFVGMRKGKKISCIYIGLITELYV